jgi:hypothetical protein
MRRKHFYGYEIQVELEKDGWDDSWFTEAEFPEHAGVTSLPSVAMRCGMCAAASIRYAVTTLLARVSPNSSTEISRILNFWILPVTVAGNSLAKRT